VRPIKIPNHSPQRHGDTEKGIFFNTGKTKKEITLFVLLALFFFLPPLSVLADDEKSAQEELQQSLEYFQVQKYQDARKWALYAANKGNDQAQYLMGYMDANALGGYGDAEGAFSWYLKSARQGNKNAQYQLGECYLNGNGIPKDPKSAVAWFEKAASQKHALAEFELGRCYEMGLGTRQNIHAAKLCFKSAADHGHKVFTDEQLELEAAPITLKGILTTGHPDENGENGWVLNLDQPHRIFPQKKVAEMELSPNDLLNDHARKHVKIEGFFHWEITSAKETFLKLVPLRVTDDN
jgi:tetratricopeptide (TPR) repeat protein